MVKITEVPLFPERPPDASIRQIDIALIETNDVGPQTKPQLVAQIKAFGILEPIKVIPIRERTEAYEKGFRYEVIDGRRRLDAAWKCELASIPAVVIEIGRDEAYASLIALSAHALRSENHAWELAKIQEMIAKGSSETDIARHSGMTIGQIKERMRLLSLVPDLRDAFDAGRVSFAQGKRIAAFPESIQRELAEIVAEHGKLTGPEIKAVTLARRARAAETVAFDLGDLDDDLALRPEDLADPDGGPIAAAEINPAVELALTHEAYDGAFEQIIETIAQAVDLIATRKPKAALAILREVLDAYRATAPEGDPAAAPLAPV